MKPALRKPTLFDVSSLVLVGAIWGGSFLFISLALQTFGPVTITALRVLLASAVLLLFAFFLNQRFPTAFSDWRKLAVVGLLNSALPFFLINWGQQTISSAESALLMATGTFCALMLSHFTTVDERINWARGLGVFVGFIGVAVLVVADLFAAGLGGIKGQLAVMLAGASYAASSVLARRVSYLPPVSASATAMITATCYMIPLAFIFEEPLQATLTIQAVLSILFLGVIATGFAFSIRFIIIRNNGAVFMAQVGYLVPLFGVIWSWLFLTDVISIQTWIALALIVIGIGITRRGVR